MKYCVVIRLSRFQVSLYYAGERVSRQGLSPMFDGSVGMPLAIYASESKLELGLGALKAFDGGSPGAFYDIFNVIRETGTFEFGGECHPKSALLLVAVEQQLSLFLSSVLYNKCGSLEDIRPHLPLGIVFDADVSAASRDFLLDQLSNKGYGNVSVISLDHYRLNHLRNSPYAMIVSSNHSDLFCSLYERSSRKLLRSDAFRNHASDPRVDSAAEMIWNDISVDAPYLDRAGAWPVLQGIAREFLSGNRTEYEGEVHLEGFSHEFLLNRKEIDRSLIDTKGKELIVNDILEMMRSENVSKDQCSVVLAPALADNAFLRDAINGTFPEMAVMDSSFETALLDEIGFSIAANDYIMADSGVPLPPGLRPSSAVGSAVADTIPLRNIKYQIGETSIAFNITFPEGVKEIEVYRDNVLMRTPAVSAFTDEGLLPSHTYAYTFVGVFTDSTNARIRSAARSISLTTASVALPSPVSLSVEDDGQSILLSWTRPERGDIRVYVSDTPFGKNFNDRIRMEEFNHTPLSTLEMCYRVERNFCGERFYLPVIVVGDIGVVGNGARVVSATSPEGVRLSDENGLVVVHWLWNDMPAVRIRWRADDGNEEHKDIVRDADTLSKHILRNLPKNAQTIKVCVTSLVKTSSGEVAESVERNWLSTSQKPIVIHFRDFRDESLAFFRKDRYSVTIESDSTLPCALHLVLTEGGQLYDLSNYNETLSIQPEDLPPKTAKKMEFTYKRYNKKGRLFARLVVPDADLRSRIKIYPETKNI